MKPIQSPMLAHMRAYFRDGAALEPQLGSLWHLILEPPLGAVLRPPWSLVATRGHPEEITLGKKSGPIRFQNDLCVAVNISASALVPLMKFALRPTARRR